MRMLSNSLTGIFNGSVILCFLFTVTLSAAYAQPLCHDDERSALLQFKESFFSNTSALPCPYPCQCTSPSVASWTTDGTEGNCCTWHGIECDSLTSRVIGLDLSCNYLYGSIYSNSSLFRLVHLQKLNLAYNNFNYSEIPATIGQLSELTYLNLSYSLFVGQIPLEISKLAKLSVLDLSGGEDRFRLELQNPSLNTLIQHLNNLEILQLSNVNISSTVPDILANLTSLKFLHLHGCGIHGRFPEGVFHLPKLQDLRLSNNQDLNGTLPEFNMSNPLESLTLCGTGFHGEFPPSIGNLVSLTKLDVASSGFSGLVPPELGNLSQLTYLDLTYNNFSGQIPSSFEKLTKLQILKLGGGNRFDDRSMPWLGKLTNLIYLGLQAVNLTGTIPPSLGNLKRLQALDLQKNKLTGQIPSWLGSLTELTNLDLRENQFQDSIPQSFANLANLEYLYLLSNNLSGSVDFDMFLRLQKLKKLHLSYNNLTILTNSSSKNASFPKFTELGLRSCNLNQFPDFLRYQDQMEWLDLSENNITHQIPRWLLDVSKETLQALYLSHNVLTGFELPLVVLPFHRLAVLDLTNNMLQGEIPIPPSSIAFYLASNNRFNGEIPHMLCNLNSLNLLDLSNNRLSGSLPSCLGSYNSSTLAQNLPENNAISQQHSPDTCSLKSINLSNNRLQGPLPISLANCKQLEYFDISSNQINDTFPTWVGTLPSLKVVLLHFNQFYGQLKRPNRIKNWFTDLHIFDISHNKFQGYLASDFFQGWHFMETTHPDSPNYLRVSAALPFENNYWLSISYDQTMTITIKGLVFKYPQTQYLLTVIGLASNRFEGDIPDSFGNLPGLRSLNISQNRFSGRIPLTLKNLGELESLDISYNNITGKIPPELATLHSLGTFRASHNHLEGPIPRGPQFDGFQDFDGNPGLCGFQLPNGCERSPISPDVTIEEEEDGGSDSGLIFEWKGVAIGYGFGLAIGISGGMIFTRRRNQWFETTLKSKRQRQRGRKASGRRSWW